MEDSAASVIDADIDACPRSRLPRPSNAAEAEGTLDCSKDSEDYPMTEKGVCFIFNQKVFDTNNKLKERSGTDIDADLLESFFKAIDFEVCRFDNCGVNRVMYELQNVSSSKDYFEKFSCFVCCILSYESEPGTIYAKDKTYPIKRVFERFYANKCVALAGKPKIFFIQACGIESEPSVQRSIRQSTDSGFEDDYKIHTMADFLVVNSTVPGFYSWENSNKGTWFIEALCQTLQKQIGEIDLLQRLEIVNRKLLYDYQKHFGCEGIELKARVPCVTSTLIRNIKFPVPCSLVSKVKNIDLDFSYESESYLLNSTKKGKVYIFNHEKFENNSEREGTNKDFENLKTLFQELNFDVETFHDYRKDDIVKELTNVASIAHDDFGCFICCILTHGDYGTLSAKDDDYNIDNIFSPFHGKWVGKPKIYFIQACRGNLFNFGARIRCNQSTDSGDASKDYNFMPFSYPDFFIACATVPGDVSMRNPIYGSWFIQTLYNTLKKHGRNMNLEQLITIVHRDVGIKYPLTKGRNETKQIPCLTSTLTKSFKF